MYAVTARIYRVTDGWSATTHLPTFYLDEQVQGIVSNSHAEQIARSILDPYSERFDPEISGELFVDVGKVSS